MDIDSFHNMDKVRKLILPYPGVEEYTCFGTPAFRVNGKLLARLREDGATLVIRNEDREKWISMDPEVFFITDHYRNYPSLLINLTKVKEKDLQVLIQTAWESRASKKLLELYAKKNPPR
jgi:hypothetical protein